MGTVRRAFAISLCVASLAVAGCTGWDPGDDPAGRRLRHEADTRVVPAIEAYRREHGRDPDSLEDTEADLSWVPPGAWLTYRTTDDGFVLTLDYSPSWPQGGRSRCRRIPTEPGWACFDDTLVPDSGPGKIPTP